MNTKKANKYITFGVFILCAAALVVFHFFRQETFLIVIFMFLVLAAVTAITTLLERGMELKLRIMFYVLSGILLAGGLVGIILKETLLPVALYSFIFGIGELLSGAVKMYEGIMMVIKKNKMGVFFVFDALVEITMGVIVVIRKDAVIYKHLNLIAADKLYEGSIKLINSIIEERHEEKEQAAQ